MPPGAACTTWDDYRRRRRLFWFAFLGYVPVVGVVGSSLSWIVGSDLPAIAVALAWMVFSAFAGVRMKAFPCPRCGKPFFLGPFFQNPLTQRCVHCRWPKWRERTTASTAARSPSSPYRN